MDKSKIFIASSSRTLLLGEKLRDELQTDYCEAIVWSEVGRSQPGATISCGPSFAEQPPCSTVRDVTFRPIGCERHGPSCNLFVTRLFIRPRPRASRKMEATLRLYLRRVAIANLLVVPSTRYVSLLKLAYF